jgi:Glycosyltransferases involved in cell wall biogenesis
VTDLVSVVIPTFNRARDLARALQSLVAQSHTGWEAIIVDNHSTDETAAVVRGFDDSRMKFLQIHTNGVIAASRNKAIEAATGDFVAFLDSDDYWKPEKLDCSLEALRAGNDVSYHDMHVVSERRFYFGRRRFPTRQLSSPVYRDLLVNGNTLPTSSVVVRKTVLDAAGKFSEEPRMIAGEDYDLWLRLAGVTERFKRVDGTLGYLSRGSDNAHGSLRLLSILKQIELDHVPRLSKKDSEALYANWLDYLQGRALYQQGKRKDAKRHLYNVLKKSGSPALRLKALYMVVGSGGRSLLGR